MKLESVADTYDDCDYKLHTSCSYTQNPLCGDAFYFVVATIPVV